MGAIVSGIEFDVRAPHVIVGGIEFDANPDVVVVGWAQFEMEEGALESSIGTRRRATNTRASAPKITPQVPSSNYHSRYDAIEAARLAAQVDEEEAVIAFLFAFALHA